LDTASPLLELKGVGKRFGGTVALSDIDWSVQAGEVHCLIGENGSGKSTLIKIVAGVHAPDAGGQIAIGGEACLHLSPQRSKALGVQVIYQDLSLFPNLTVLENIAFDHDLGNSAGFVDRVAMRVSAEQALKQLDAKLPLDVRVDTLPIAQRQIVAICRGIASNARLVFMDEPTASLTRHEVNMLLGVVRRLKSLGVSVVFVSHRLDEIVEIAERVTVLRDGKKVGTFPAAEIDNHRLAELMTGNRIEHEVHAHEINRSEPVLEIRNAGRCGEFENISFALHRGEVLGVTGLLGAGRTELALALFGMERFDQGEVLLNGTLVRLDTNQDAIAAGIAYVSEDRLTLGLNLRQSISDNIAITVLDRLKGSFGTVAPDRRRSLAQDWITRLTMRAPDALAPVQTLSGGNQQRVVLAKWLATQPKVLILDTPTAGVDIRNKQGIYDVVHQLAATGVSILLISDEIPEVYFNCDRILHMREGRVVDEFVPGLITEEAMAEAVYA
jgi:simple sugar transport system ATP-binding protein